MLGDTGASAGDGAGSGRSSDVPGETREATASGETGQVLRYCDFRDFLRHLGVDPSVGASGIVMVVVHLMFAAALPPHWSEQVDEGSGRVYFFNRISGESLWVHPQAELFKELIEEVRSWPLDESSELIFARSDAHLRQAHQTAVEIVAQWTAHDAPQGSEEASEGGESSQFFFNAASGETRWSDPRQSVAFDLRQRHSLLCECIAVHTQNLSRMAKNSTRSSESSESEPQHDSVQALVANLWQSIGALPLPARRAPPGDAPARESLDRPACLPAGDETVRSTMSYLTARSSQS